MVQSKNYHDVDLGGSGGVRGFNAVPSSSTSTRGNSSSSSLGFSRSTSNSSTSRSRQKQQRRRRWCLMGTIFVLVVIAIVVLTNYESLIRDNKLIPKKGDVISKSIDKNLMVTFPFHPQFDTIDHRNHYYIIPTAPSSSQTSTNHSSTTNETISSSTTNDVDDESKTTTTTTSHIKGVLLYFHSCYQSGLELFHLPEHRILVQDAIQRQRFAVFAPTSSDRTSGCYTANDVERIPSLIEEWLQRHELQSLPRVAIGDSSGGSFLSFVWKDLNVQRIALYNTPISYEWDMILPTAVVTMQHDEIITNKVTEYVSMLQNMNISTQLLTVKSKPFTTLTCSTRLPEMVAFTSSSSSTSSSNSKSSKSNYKGNNDDVCTRMMKIIRKDYSQLFDSYGYIKETEQPLHQNGQWMSLLSKLESTFQPPTTTPATKDGVTTTSSSSSSIYDTSKAGNGRSWFSTVLEHEFQSCQGFHALVYVSDVMEFLTTNIHS